MSERTGAEPGYGFVVACHDAKTGGLKFLCDRSKTKQAWWTKDQLDLVVEFRFRNAAKAVMKRLQHNNPRVIRFSEAQALIRQQSPEKPDNEHDQVS